MQDANSGTMYRNVVQVSRPLSEVQRSPPRPRAAAPRRGHRPDRPPRPARQAWDPTFTLWGPPGSPDLAASPLDEASDEPTVGQDGAREAPSLRPTLPARPARLRAVRHHGAAARRRVPAGPRATLQCWRQRTQNDPVPRPLHTLHTLSRYLRAALIARIDSPVCTDLSACLLRRWRPPRDDFHHGQMLPRRVLWGAALCGFWHRVVPRRSGWRAERAGRVVVDRARVPAWRARARSDVLYPRARAQRMYVRLYHFVASVCASLCTVVCEPASPV